MEDQIPFGEAGAILSGVSRSPLRVVHAVHWPRSGIVALIRNMLPLFPAERVESHVVVLAGDEGTEREFAGLCASSHGLKFSRFPLRGLFRYGRLLRRIDPHILHAHSFQAGVWGRLCLGDRAKFVCTVHNQYPYFTALDAKSRIKRLVEARSWRRHGTRIVCVSPAVKESVARLLPGYPVAVIENGIVLGKWQGGKIPSPPGEVRLVSMGRLDFQKGLDILLRAFALARGRRDNLRLWIIGEGEERRPLEALARQLGIEGSIIFSGHLADPRPALLSADIYVCSSRYEGNSLAVAEALALGLPVISTPVSGIPSQPEFSGFGLLAEKENPQSLGEAILRLAEDGRKREELGRRGRVFVRERFDLRKTVQAYLEVYEQALVKSA